MDTWPYISAIWFGVVIENAYPHFKPLFLGGGEGWDGPVIGSGIFPCYWLGPLESVRNLPCQNEAVDKDE